MSKSHELTYRDKLYSANQTLTPTQLRKTATELGLECDVHTDVCMSHFEVHVTEGDKKAQDCLAEYIKNRKPTGASFNVVDDTPKQGYWEKVDAIGNYSNKDTSDEIEEDVMREIEYDGHKIVITEDLDLYVDDIDITDRYEGQPATGAAIADIKHKIAAGKLPPTEDHAVSIKNVGQLFNGSGNNTAKTVDDVKQRYVDGEISILALEEELEDVIELEYEPTAHPT